MRKLLFIPLCLSLFLTSCNDDEETVIPVVSELDADMRGDWTNTAVERIYYSTSGDVMYADTSKRQANFHFDGQKMTVTLPGGSDKDVWNYSFPDPNDSTYIRLQRDAETNDYIVTSLSGDEMVWVDELDWAGFPEEAPDQEKTTSRRGVYTWKFVRKK
ncbi:hypothetical protein [Pontibacter chinhatensis]|uniref:Lipocalin-like domain-containing protein n=1 Tax=Pontibacter chinhatensis TaxID=1436961 RepID=A0A1I2X2U9_9BACT|nr:hypothetical protein [Pontibacter chinhatensis]SFH07848.1 hypothetical protein SAMN05421739_105353 [Pontibacter chinhatensis]